MLKPIFAFDAGIVVNDVGVGGIILFNRLAPNKLACWLSIISFVSIFSSIFFLFSLLPFCRFDLPINFFDKYLFSLISLVCFYIHSMHAHTHTLNSLTNRRFYFFLLDFFLFVGPFSDYWLKYCAKRLFCFSIQSLLKVLFIFFAVKFVGFLRSFLFTANHHFPDGIFSNLSLILISLQFQEKILLKPRILVKENVFCVWEKNRRERDDR